MEIFVIVNALCGIAAFLGVRFIYRRSKEATKRGFDVITKGDDDELTYLEKEHEPPKELQR
jgi:hypothetical protein